jgi:hypothetical protein
MSFYLKRLQIIHQSNSKIIQCQFVLNKVILTYFQVYPAHNAGLDLKINSPKKVFYFSNIIL